MTLKNITGKMKGRVVLFKVLIWDYAGVSSHWLEQVADMKDIEVVGTITPAAIAPEILLKKDAWDWLLIFEHKMREFFDVTLLALKLPLDKVIYALDINSWIKHPKAIYALLNDSDGITIRRWVDFINFRKQTDFVTCTVEGLSYIAPSTDEFRMMNMFVNGVNWASNDMKRFHSLVEKYYDVDDDTGYFLDLGANIGTTGLYFCKKLAPKLRLLAFEPDPENFKMHRVNIILNNMEEITDLINCGLSNESNELMLYRNGANSGANGFIRHPNSTPISTVKIIPLDAYLAEKQIAAQEVKYIWIDTEGFEPQVLLGAKNLLRKNPAPIFMECNLRAWAKSGFFEDMMNLLAEGYSHFIHVQGGETVYPLEALRNIERPNNPLGKIGDIFLIKKGTIK